MNQTSPWSHLQAFIKGSSWEERCPWNRIYSEGHIVQVNCYSHPHALYTFLKTDELQEDKDKCCVLAHKKGEFV